MTFTSRTRKAWDLAISGNLARETGNRIRSRPRRLLNSTLAERSKSPSARRINLLLNAIEGSSFLEVGVNAGFTFEGVGASRKVGVDPDPIFELKSIDENCDFHVCDSDTYFANFRTEVFSLVFVDGLHEYFQAYRDVINSVNSIAEGGVVLVDDSVPSDRFSAMRDPEESVRLRREAGLLGSPWHGDVFLAVLALARFHPELTIRTTSELPHQTIVFWELKGGNTRPSVLKAESELEELRELNFNDVFSAGIPSEFGLCNFSNVLLHLSELNSSRNRTQN